MMRAVLSSMVLFLSGCGFTPLYSSVGGEGLSERFEEVNLAPIQGPEAARLALDDALRKQVPQTMAGARFGMTINLREQRRAVAVTVDNSTRRFNYTLAARIQYTDNETGEVRTQNLQSVVGYGVVSSQFATLVSQEDAIRRAALDLARKIETDLVLYVQGRAPKGSEPTMFEQNNRRDPLQQLDRDVREPAIGNDGR